MDFASLPVGDLRRLLDSPRMGEAARDRIAHRIREMEQAPQPGEGKHAGPVGVTVLPGSSPTVLLKTGKRRGKMNMTETRSYKDRIAPMLATGEIVRAEFEGATWHVHEVAKYTPDWVCWMPYDETHYAIWNIEIKAKGSMREKDKIRFLLHRKARPWMRWSLWMWDRKEKRWSVRYDFRPGDAHASDEESE